MKPTIILATLLGLLGSVSAHTWVEQMQTIDMATGNFTGDYGYTRGYVARTDPTFTGNSDDYLLPPLTSGRTRINSTDLLCHPSQRTANYSSAYPRLSVTSGGWVAMKYLENGHVTLPQNQLGKPKAAGTVFVYGTTQPWSTEAIADVLSWTSDGEGGDKRGSLLTAQTFDDGRCHELNSGTLSTQRQQEFPDPNPGQPTSKMPLWCETDLQIPTTAKTGETLTLYWVWQWPTEAGADPTYPTGKDEYYTSCADVSIVDSITNGAPVHTLVQQDPMASAVSTFKSRTAYTSSPSVTLAGATGGYYTLATGASSASATSSYTTPSPTSAAARGSSSSSVASSALSYAPLTTTSTVAPYPAANASSVAAQVTITVTDMVTITAAPASSKQQNTTTTVYATTSSIPILSSSAASSFTPSSSTTTPIPTLTYSSSSSSSTTSSSSTSTQASGFTARSMALPYITIVSGTAAASSPSSSAGVTGAAAPPPAAGIAKGRLRRHIASHRGARYRF